MPPKKKAVKKPAEEEAEEAPPKKTSKKDSPAKASKASSPKKADQDAGDETGLSALFTGSDVAVEWGKTLIPLLTSQPNVDRFLGPQRDKDIVPVRELTFQALKPTPPGDWNVVIFGQNPYPRVDSATGIAMFDNALDTWDNKRFGMIVTMRCIIKAAAMAKYDTGRSATIADIRSLLKSKGIVSPPEWFQAMLTQGVLLLNAVLTTGGTPTRADHSRFWMPIVKHIIAVILQAKQKKRGSKGMVFAWWGTESLKVKKFLDPTFAEYGKGVNIQHITHANPAATGDIFCDKPCHFTKINECLEGMGINPIDWLPDQSWKKRLSRQDSSTVERMGDFISDTQKLHKMYLDRLKDGLTKVEDLTPIDGIMKMKRPALEDACMDINLDGQAQQAVIAMQKRDTKGLHTELAASIHMYTCQYLYSKLNGALRDKNRKKCEVYFPYLRVFLEGLGAMKPVPSKLYRGVSLDLSAQYPTGSTITWWAVSSCTPSEKVAKAFSTSGGTIFVVHTETAVSIQHLSAFKDEDEWILAPGTQLKVKQVEKTGGRWVITLVEVTGKRLVQ
eukprot:Sspe_Gene.38767::Locus_18700_Transcript_1_1_Confidence_1.000_Length_1781::g.38767::m.38767